MSLSTPFIKRPIGTSLLATGTLLGIGALPRIEALSPTLLWGRGLGEGAWPTSDDAEGSLLRPKGPKVRHRIIKRPIQMKVDPLTPALSPNDEAVGGAGVK